VPYIFFQVGVQLLHQPDNVTVLYLRDHEVRRVRLARDRPMAEPSLDGPVVVALVAAGVAEHVRMRLEAARSIIRAKPAVVNGVPRSLTKMKGRRRALPLEPAQGPHLVGCDMPADEVRREWAHGTGA
jgi:hypothetical protein